MLRIAKLTDYAIVLLAHLARHAHVCVHPTSELAEATSVPQPTVAKVMKALAKAELVVSVRGARGGYSLGRHPRDISVADVVAAVEGPVALTACSLAAGESCADEGHCQLSGHWPPINAAVVRALEGVTLDDLARPAPSVLRSHMAAPVAAQGK